MRQRRGLLLVAVLVATMGIVAATVRDWSAKPFWERDVVAEGLTVPHDAASQEVLKASILGGPQPAVVETGEVLNFTVRLSNPTDVDVALDPCPFYRMGVDSDLEADSYTLRLEACTPAAFRGLRALR